MELSVNSITKSFGEKQVLKDVSLHVQSGQALGLLGRNGAGKTTTIRIVMNVFPGDTGSVLLDGENINRKKIQFGYLPEERGLYPKKRIIDQLVYLGALRGMRTGEAKANAKHWLERLAMGEYIDKKLDTLSKGNQQKIQLAATLIGDPQIVILDEPFSGLDPVNAMLLKDVVRELIAKGKIVLFSSHQMNYIEEFCNTIAIINNGRIVLSGNIREIKRSYDRCKIVVTTMQNDRVKTFFENDRKGIVENVRFLNAGEGRSEPEERELLVKLVSAEKKNELILALAQQDFDIDGIRVYEPSLSDIFVEYTENEEAGA